MGVKNPKRMRTYFMKGPLLFHIREANIPVYQLLGSSIKYVRNIFRIVDPQPPSPPPDPYAFFVTSSITNTLAYALAQTPPPVPLRAYVHILYA